VGFTTNPRFRLRRSRVNELTSMINKRMMISGIHRVDSMMAFMAIIDDCGRGAENAP
jgi:hypothetical protein